MYVWWHNQYSVTIAIYIYHMLRASASGCHNKGGRPVKVKGAVSFHDDQGRLTLSVC